MGCYVERGRHLCCVLTKATSLHVAFHVECNSLSSKSITCQSLLVEGMCLDIVMACLIFIAQHERGTNARLKKNNIDCGQFYEVVAEQRDCARSDRTRPSV